MAAGLEPVRVLWTGWGIHVTVVISFSVQVTLLLLSDIRRRKDWALLKVVIWSAYMLADTTAIYALGHMSVLCNWSPEHHLMALWAPLLLVHLGGQDNLTAYAIEDNRLWLRHLQTLVLQVVAAVYVLHVSGILSQSNNAMSSSKLRSAAILMLVVGIVKYGERIWALKRADSCASSSLSPTSYAKALSVPSRTAAGDESNKLLARAINERNRHLILAYSLLDVPRQMFAGPTTYVQISSSSSSRHNVEYYETKHMLGVVEMQLWMMYDLLYTKAAVVHTWYGLCSRVIVSLPCTVAALALFRHVDRDDGYYRRADVAITNVLLIGAVVLEIMSVVRAIFSKWTAILLYARGWNTPGDAVFSVALFATRAIGRLARRGAFCLYELSRHSECICSISCRNKLQGTLIQASLDPWLGRMRQHSLFELMWRYSNYSVCRKLAKKLGAEDWWDTNVYSSSTEVPALIIRKVLELVSSESTQDMMKSHAGLNALLQRHMNNNEQLAAWIWMHEPEMKLEDRILVWHIATHVYTWCYRGHSSAAITEVRQAAEALAKYMFFLLAARPYMLPYPVSRQAYAQLCSDTETYLRYGSLIVLHDAVVSQKDALIKGTPLQPAKRIGRRPQSTAAAAQPQPQPPMNSILDSACQLAAKLIHITAAKTQDINDIPIQTKGDKGKRIIVEEAETSVSGEDIITEQAKSLSINGEAVLNMVLEVWVQMLCYTASLCNENSHAKHLTDGGEIMTIVTLVMIYKNNQTMMTSTRGTATGRSSSSQAQGARATAVPGSSSSQTTRTDIESGPT